MTDMKTEERIMGAGSDMNMNTTSLIYVFLKSSRKNFQQPLMKQHVHFSIQ